MEFCFFPSIYDLKDEFYLPSYEAGDWWNKEYVPFSWQMRGYDKNQYTNIRYPFPYDPPYVPQDNPCGAAEQTASCINMLHVMYLWLPMIFNLLITLILTRLNVEKAVEDLKKEA